MAPLNAARAAGQGAQNTLIQTASVLTGIELTSAHQAVLRAEWTVPLGPGAITLSRSRTGRLCGTDRGALVSMADQLTYLGAGMRPWVRTEIQPCRAQSGCGKDTVQLGEVELRSVNGKPSGRKGEQLELGSTTRSVSFQHYIARLKQPRIGRILLGEW